ncbi:MAG TPA: hypothetical protein VFQ61_07605 [Polyangiaceae bacterium]|nr:hypothetical protein [Polyangiaceae bacterium]
MADMRLEKALVMAFGSRRRLGIAVLVGMFASCSSDSPPTPSPEGGAGGEGTTDGGSMSGGGGANHTGGSHTTGGMQGGNAGRGGSSSGAGGVAEGSGGNTGPQEGGSESGGESAQGGNATGGSSEGGTNAGGTNAGGTNAGGATSGGASSGGATSSGGNTVLGGATSGGTASSGGTTPQSPSPLERCHRGAIQILLPDREGGGPSGRAHNVISIGSTELRVQERPFSRLQLGVMQGSDSAHLDWCPSWSDTCEVCDGTCPGPSSATDWSRPLRAADVFGNPDARFLPAGVRDVQVTCNSGNCSWSIQESMAGEPSIELEVSHDLPDQRAVSTISFEFGESSDCRLVEPSDNTGWECQSIQAATPLPKSPILLKPETPYGPMAEFRDAATGYTNIAPILDSSLNLGTPVPLRLNLLVEHVEEPFTELPLGSIYWTPDRIEARWEFNLPDTFLRYDGFAAFDKQGNQLEFSYQQKTQLTVEFMLTPLVQIDARGAVAWRYSSRNYDYVHVFVIPDGGQLGDLPVLPIGERVSMVNLARAGSRLLLLGNNAEPPSCLHSAGNYFLLPGTCVGQRVIGSIDTGAIVLQPQAEALKLLRLDEYGYLTSPILEVAKAASGSEGAFVANVGSNSQSTAVAWADSANSETYHWLLVDNVSLRPLTQVFTEPGSLPKVVPIAGDWVFLQGEQFRTLRCGPKTSKLSLSH